jgi:hypothetical protein
MDRFEVSSRWLSAPSFLRRAHHHAIAESVRFKSAPFHCSASEKAEPALESPPGDDPPMGIRGCRGNRMITAK